jgi:hypothetical protein
MTGTKRNQALRLDGMPGRESKPEALRDGSEQEHRFGRGESCSNTDTAAAAEGQVRETRTGGGLFR